MGWMNKKNLKACGDNRWELVIVINDTNKNGIHHYYNVSSKTNPIIYL
jgi:hypothetical protein